MGEGYKQNTTKIEPLRILMIPQYIADQGILNFTANYSGNLWLITQFSLCIVKLMILKLLLFRALNCSWLKTDSL